MSSILAGMITERAATRKRPEQASRRRGATAEHVSGVIPDSETALDAGTKRSSSLSPVAWIPMENMDFGEWAMAGRRLSAMGRCGQWGLGDWIRYGNAKFGERYAWAARVTGYDVQTLMNMVYVSSRFHVSRRRENLSWSHHETIAALEPAEQDRWLDRAVADRLSISDLRAELRSLRRGVADGVSTPDTARAAAPAAIPCPHCGGSVPLPSIQPRRAGKRRRASSDEPERGELDARAGGQSE
jgi:hypothetical protein